MRFTSTLLVPVAFGGVLAWNAVADQSVRNGVLVAISARGAQPCHVRGHGLFVLPDASCTPGLADPAVTQRSIGRTICKPGWTRTVRPSESVTGPIKRQLIRAYGYYAGRKISGYELDHLVSLELGGAPNDARNFWPEVDYAGGSPHTYYRNPKDKLERVLNRRVCARQMSLSEARRLIGSGWVTAYRRYVG